MNKSDLGKKLKSFTTDIEAIVNQMKFGDLSVHAANGAECTLKGIRNELIELKAQHGSNNTIFNKTEELLENTLNAVNRVNGSSYI